MTLNDELIVIDETIAELEGRRTELINRMDLRGRRRPAADKNVIEFPNGSSVVEARYHDARHVW